MTVSVQTLIDRSVKNMGAVHPHVKECAIEMIKEAYKEGIYVQISAGLRTDAQQNALYAQGRTAPGNIVTNAKAGQSIHNYGYAIDFFLVTPDGKTALWNVNSDWKRVAAIGKSLGFTWGGDWTSFKDYPHLDFAGNHSWQEFANGWRPNLPGSVPKPSKPASKPKPSKKWKAKNGKWTGQVLEKWDSGTMVKDLQTKLANAYFYPEKGAKNNGVDGYYGANTVDAVKRYQTMNGLAVDGVAGKKTYEKLVGKKSASKPKKKKPNISNKGKKGKLKIVGVSNAAIVMDKPDRNNSKNLGTVKKNATLPLNGSVRGKNSSTGYWEVEFNGRLGYITGKYGKQI